jgi:hypothetical protein
MKSDRVTFRVERLKASYDFKKDPRMPDGFENNWKNNSRDRLIVLYDRIECCRFRCQTVANYCFGGMATADTVAHGDTIAPGEFTVACFVPPRGFHGEIHAITRTRDLDGQWIDHRATQTTRGGFQNGRWLIHSRYASRLQADTRYAWSAGCFITSSPDLSALNDVLHAYGIVPGDLLPGTLVEM